MVVLMSVAIRGTFFFVLSKVALLLPLMLKLSFNLQRYSKRISSNNFFT